MDERFMEHAAALEQLHRDAAIANVCSPPPDSMRLFFDGTHCVEPDCGDEIPAARLAFKAIRCVTCQTLKEKHRAH